MSASPVRVVPLVVSLGVTGGQRVDLLSCEVWDQWWDLRFARVDVGATTPLPRRIPPDDAWKVVDDLGTSYEVVDAVGRGDRGFSNGEVRLRPSLSPDALWIHVSVDVGPGVLASRIALT